MSQHPVHVEHDAQRPSLAERVAQPVAAFLGTGRYLAMQTALVALWITYNALIATRTLRFDAFPFVLLNLVFSTQASYAAPLILLAQNKQAALDRARADHDHVASDENLRLTREIHQALTREGQ